MKIDNNYCQDKGRGNQVQYINLSNNALNGDDSSFLQKEYLHLIKKLGKTVKASV